MLWESISPNKNGRTFICMLCVNFLNGLNLINMNIQELSILQLAIVMGIMVTLNNVKQTENDTSLPHMEISSLSIS